MEIIGQVSRCSNDLAECGLQQRKKFLKNLSSCQKNIARYKGGRDPESVEIFNIDRKGLNDLLAQQERYWKQRAKQIWLKHGTLTRNSSILTP